jgi:hypothetical protein
MMTLIAIWIANGIMLLWTMAHDPCRLDLVAYATLAFSIAGILSCLEWKPRRKLRP